MYNNKNFIKDHEEHMIMGFSFITESLSENIKKIKKTGELQSDTFENCLESILIEACLYKSIDFKDCKNSHNLLTLVCSETSESQHNFIEITKYFIRVLQHKYTDDYMHNFAIEIWI